MESKKIIKLYLTISSMFTLSASLIWGINTLFLLNAGLNIFQVFIVNAVYTGSMAIFEIPTGVFADTLGRKFSFFVGTVVLMFGTLAYVWVSSFENNYSLFIITSAILGLAYTFYSGAVEAWLVDALNFSGFSGNIDSVFAKGNIVSSISMLIGTVSGGLLGSISLIIPYLLRSFTLVSVAFIAITFMKDIGFEKRALTLKRIPIEMKHITIDSLKYGIHHKSVRKLMTVSFIFSSFMMWGWYAWQPHFLELFGNRDAIWVAGLISAGMSLSMAIGSASVSKALKHFSRRSSLLLSAYITKAIMLLIVGLSNSFVLSVSAFLVFSYCLGLAMPVKQSYLNSLIPSKQRATIISFDSLVGSTGSVIGQVSLGSISQSHSIPLGYFIGGIIMFFVIPPLARLNTTSNKEDLIIKDS